MAARGLVVSLLLTTLEKKTGLAQPRQASIFPCATFSLYQSQKSEMPKPA